MKIIMMSSGIIKISAHAITLSIDFEYVSWRRIATFRVCSVCTNLKCFQLLSDRTVATIGGVEQLHSESVCVQYGEEEDGQ